MIQERPYQAESIEAAFRLWDSGVRSVLVQLATGCGKTHVAAECARVFHEQKGLRTLFAVHLREIVRESKNKIQDITGIPTALELAGERSSTIWPEPIICGSVQTLNGRGRLLKFDPEYFGLIIIDECHHLPSQSWVNILDYFPNAKVLGLTATPERKDKKKIGKVIEAIAYQYDLKQACDDGWLVKPRQLTIEVPGLDFRKIPRKQGELAKEELERIMVKYAVQCAQKSIEAIFDLYPHELDGAEDWNAYIGDKPAKKTLIFCVTRLHADKVRNTLNSFREGLCGYVDGETPHIERRNTFRDFKTGNLACLANVGVTTEGYDNPYIELILDMAPTMSHSRALQKWGRGTRTLPGTLDNLNTPEDRLLAIANSDKPYITIADFTDNSRDHRLITLMDIFGEDQPESVKREVEKRMKDKATDVETEIELVLKERYELRHAEFSEVEIDGFTGKKKKKKLSKEQKETRRTARLKQPVSDKQWAMLEQQKLNPERRSVEENKMLIKQMQHRRLAGLCTFRQGFTLQKYGYAKSDLEHMSFGEATRSIDAIANNGWKRVSNL